MIPVIRAPQRFRVWESRLKHMHYPQTDKHAYPLGSGLPCSGTCTSFLLQQGGALVLTDGLHVHPLSLPLTEQLLPLQDTGLTTKDGRSIWEGDIISFTINGAAHAREPDHCAAAHVWWCAEDACWAFGRWIQTIPASQHFAHQEYDWWYTAADGGFNHDSLKVLGNLFENPELIPSLGYTPSL